MQRELEGSSLCCMISKICPYPQPFRPVFCISSCLCEPLLGPTQQIWVPMMLAQVRGLHHEHLPVSLCPNCRYPLLLNIFVLGTT